MERQIAIVGIDGQLALSPDIRAALGLQPGSRVEVSIEDRNIVLHPIPGDTIEELRGMFAAGPSLEDDFFRDRDQDRW